MASVKISELNEILVISGSDYVAIVDSSSLTTYRTNISTIGDWMADFGSASHALWADNAISASYALSSSFTDSGSNSISASYALTASYFNFNFDPNTSISSSYSETASVLQGFGTSWEENLQISSSLRLATDAAFIIPRKTNLTWNDKTNCIWFNDVPFVPAPGISDDYARISFIEETLDKGHLRFDHGDNVDTLYLAGPDIDFQYATKPGFGWFTMDFSNPYPTGSLMFLSTGGELYVRKVEARNFSSSINPGIGFYGTASYAMEALTASYVSGGPLPSDTKMPWIINGLVIYPYWDIYEPSDYWKIQVKVRQLVVHDTSGNTAHLSNVSQVNNRTGANAGGVVSGYSADQWFDVFVIYRSDTEAQSTVIKASGATPDTQTFTDDVAPALVSGSQPEWDYGMKVGSVHDTGGKWDQWMEYGPRVMMAYRNIHPSDFGISNGYTIQHNMARPPRNLEISIKARKSTTGMLEAGYIFGYELRDVDSIIDVDGGDPEMPTYVTFVTPTEVQVGLCQYTEGWKGGGSQGERVKHAAENWAILIYAWE